MHFQAIIVFTLCIGHVNANGLMDMFTSFAELNSNDSSSDTAHLADLPPDFFLPDGNNTDPWDFPLDTLPHDNAFDATPDTSSNTVSHPGDIQSIDGKPSEGPAVSSVDTATSISNSPVGQPVDLGNLNPGPSVDNSQDPQSSKPQDPFQFDFLSNTPSKSPDTVSNPVDTVDTSTSISNSPVGQPVDLTNLNPGPWVDNSQDPQSSKPQDPFQFNFLPNTPSKSPDTVSNPVDTVDTVTSISNSPVGQPVDLRNLNPGPSVDNSQDSQVFPPFDVNPLHKDSTHNRDMTFFPAIPLNANVVDLVTGNTKPFKPVANIIGEKTVSHDTAGQENSEVIAKTNRGISSVSITQGSDSRADSWSSGGGSKPVNIMKTGNNMGIVPLPIDVHPATIDNGNIGPIPLGPINAIPLGPGTVRPVDITPHKTESKKNTNQFPGRGRIPVEWMTLYPNGRPPRPNLPVPSEPEIEPLTPAEIRLAHNTLNNFGKNRRLSRMYRKQRREKARRMRKLRKQQKQQNKLKNKRSQETGPKGARVAKMIVPHTKKPFVGKRQRGRKSKSPCTRLQRRRGLCSSVKSASFSNKVSNKRIKRRAGKGRRNRNFARGQGKGARRNRNGARSMGNDEHRVGNVAGGIGSIPRIKGRKGRRKGNRGRWKGKTKQIGELVQHEGAFHQDIINLPDVQAKGGQVAHDNISPEGLIGDNLQTEHIRVGKNKKRRKWKKKNKGKKRKPKVKAVKELVPVDLTVHDSTSIVGPKQEAINSQNQVSTHAPGFGDINWKAAQGTGLKSTGDNVITPRPDAEYIPGVGYIEMRR